MDFENAVGLIGTVTNLRRAASADVIDYNELKDNEPRSVRGQAKAAAHCGSVGAPQ